MGSHCHCDHESDHGADQKLNLENWIIAFIKCKKYDQENFHAFLRKHSLCFVEFENVYFMVSLFFCS